MNGRLEAMFEGLGGRRAALITYATAFYPDLEGSRRAIESMLEHGADAVEIGIPFSDPVMDGPVIQQSSARALEAGASVHGVLELLSVLRLQTERPLMLMTYYNPVFRYGLETFARDADDAGADCLIVPDLPAEEATPLRLACGSAGLPLAGFCAPNTTASRLVRISAVTSGFLYCVSLLGTTGERDRLPPGLPGFLSRARRHCSRPVAVGVGISTPAQCAAAGVLADGVIVGSALVRALEGGGAALSSLGSLVSTMAGALRDAPPASFGEGAGL